MGRCSGKGAGVLIILRALQGGVGLAGFILGAVDVHDVVHIPLQGDHLAVRSVDDLLQRVPAAIIALQGHGLLPAQLDGVAEPGLDGVAHAAAALLQGDGVVVHGAVGVLHPLYETGIGLPGVGEVDDELREAALGVGVPAGVAVQALDAVGLAHLQQGGVDVDGVLQCAIYLIPSKE